LYMGSCGLASQCVECITDGYCDEGMCSLEGKCVPCECEEDADCENGLLCRENRCAVPCMSSDECLENEICEEEGYCRTVRCACGPKCDVWGWRPISGTLACRYDPCHDSPTIPGVCALDRTCVGCLTDAECSEDFYCSLWGSCYKRCGEVHGGACIIGRRCVGERCEMECESDSDCLYGAGECLPEGYCHIERCAPDGSCPEGWKPGTYQTATGSLACPKIR
jgi:hypothetical protein